MIRYRNIILAFAWLSGCAVGPDYHRPAMILPATYEAGSPIDRTQSALGLDGGAQHVVYADISGAWWELFRNPALSTLVREAIARNWRLEASRAALARAREFTIAQYGGLLPRIDGTFAHTQATTPLSTSGIPDTNATYRYYDAHITLSYNLDIWGRTRRTIEDQNAQADGARFALEAALLTLTGNVAATVINAASLRAQIVEQRRLVAFEQDYLRAVRTQFTLGGANGTDVALQEAQLEQQLALLPELQDRLAEAQHALAADLGTTPAALNLPDIAFADIALPDELPVSLPISLLDQRPDIRQAEANLHRASADLGIAIADRLPQFNLQGQLGSEAIEAGELLSPGNGLATLALQAMGPIFAGGALLHRQDAARDALREQAALWRDTTIGAIRDVADALARVRLDALTLVATTAQESAAMRALSLAQAQYRLGGVPYLTVLTAENTNQTAALALVRARADRLTDTVALFVALGGGWWNRRDTPALLPGLLPSLLPWSKS